MTILLLSSTLLFAQSYWQMKKEVYQLYKTGDKKEAFKKLDHFILKHPKDYKAQNLSAVLHYWNGESKKSKEILENIVAKTNFPEAEKLLKQVNRKLGKKAKKQKISYQSIAKANQKSDLDFLLAQVDKNPHDIQNRVLLSKFYMKIQEFQKAYDVAHEVLEIDPHNKKMQKIARHLEKRYGLTYSAAIDDSAVDKHKAKAMLAKLHREKKYNAYFNLYEALRDAHVIFSKKEYVDILHTAIMIGKYKEAQEIISKGLAPRNKSTLKVQLLLAKKLAQAVASR